MQYKIPGFSLFSAEKLVLHFDIMATCLSVSISEPPVSFVMLRYLTSFL